MARVESFRCQRLEAALDDSHLLVQLVRLMVRSEAAPDEQPAQVGAAVVDVVEDVDVARADIALVDVAARAEVAFPAKLQEMQLANIVPAARAT